MGHTLREAAFPSIAKDSCGRDDHGLDIKCRHPKRNCAMGEAAASGVYDCVCGDSACHAKAAVVESETDFKDAHEQQGAIWAVQHAEFEHPMDVIEIFCLEGVGHDSSVCIGLRGPDSPCKKRKINEALLG